MQKPAPPIAYALQRIATQYQLGSPQATYKTQRESWLHRLPGILSLLIGGAVLAYFIYAYNDLFSLWPFWQMAFVLLVAVAWIVVGLCILLTPWFSPQIRIFVYEEGFIYAARKLEAVPWGQIERLWKDIHFDRKKRKVCSYVIRRNDQAFFILKSNLIDGEKLGLLLEEEITRRLLPRAITAFNAGDPIIFDTLAISARWLRVKHASRKLAWNEFEHIHVDEQILEIYKKGLPDVWVSLKVADIPNVEILRRLVGYAQQELAYRQIPSIVAYKAGFSVTFGPLTLSQRGVVINKRFLPWSEISGIAIGESEVMIKQQGNPVSWYALPIWMLSDVSSLKDLLNYIMYNSD